MARGRPSLNKTIETMAKKEYKAIGLMSGTSLDGLDMVYVVFREHDG